MDDAHGGPHAFTYAHAHFQWVLTLLNSPHTDTTHRKLLVALGELGHLTGWLARDVLNGNLATQYWHTAYKAACSAGDTALSAHVLQTMATHADHDGRPREARELYEAVLSASTRLPAGVIALTQCHATLAHAHLADLPACERAYGEAMEALSRIGDPQDQPSFLYWLNERSIQQVPGEAFLVAGQPARAETLLRQAIAPEDGYQRDDIIHETYLGLALLDQNELEAACGAARRAIGLVDQVSSPRAADHLRLLCDRMQPHADQIDIRETLDDAGAAINQKGPPDSVRASDGSRHWPQGPRIAVDLAATRCLGQQGAGHPPAEGLPCAPHC